MKNIKIVQAEDANAAEAAARASARRAELQAGMAATLQDGTARGVLLPLPFILCADMIVVSSVECNAEDCNAV